MVRKQKVKVNEAIIVVLLQKHFKDKRAIPFNTDYAATPKIRDTNSTEARMSPFSIPKICPFLI